MTTPASSPSPREIVWGDGTLRMRIAIDEVGRARVAGLTPEREGNGRAETALPLVEIVTVDRSKRSSSRYDDTDLGLDLRYVDHREETQGALEVLEVDLADPNSPLRATVRYSMRPESGVLSSSARISHSGDGSPIDLLFVSSFALGDSAWGCTDTVIHLADNDWLAESRWRAGTFAELGEPDVDMAAHGGGSPRGCLAILGRGTWSSSEHLPMGAMQDPAGATLLWQIESNGGWRWQLSQSPGDTPAGVLRLVTSGPNDAEHQWSVTLTDGDSFTTPVTTLAWSPTSFEGAVARLTEHRRADHRPFAGDAEIPVIYNDYMNTLNADPTTEKLLPLIEAVGRTGAEIFVVDAGWYSDEPGWWDSVGAWEPSTTRFSGGFDAIFDSIRSHGMIPGLWLEPEVVGVNSPIVDQLPTEAFFTRRGARVVENGRYQLDFRHPEVVARMDAVIDRLVRGYGLGYVKFDYNINPLAGTDHRASSPGAGLFDAARAYLDWIDGLHERHPLLIIENCASGGMRSDWLTLSHFALLSTSDQQDALRCVPIAAAATMVVPPEHAGVWSYPQPGMPAGVTTVTLANSLLRRPILSGRIDLLDETELAVVRDFVSAHKSLRASLPHLQSSWPLGLPGWEDQWVAAGLSRPGEAFLTVWRRGGDAQLSLALDQLLAEMGATSEPTVTQIFPTGASAEWALRDGTLDLQLEAPSAVVLRFSTN